VKVATDFNVADRLTEPPVRYKFEHLCQLLLGWYFFIVSHAFRLTR